MARLCDADQKRDFFCFKASQADRKEWLYDMTWLQQDGNRLTDVGLVLEGEWGYFSGVRTDFEKLLLAKSCLRCV